MIDQIFDFLSDFEELWMSMAYIATFAIGIAVCLVCVMIAVRVIESFVDFIRNHAGYISNACKKATKRVLDKIGERIGEAVKKVIADFKSPTPEDMRPKMVGSWESPNGDRMKIEHHDGYFIVKFRECKSDKALSYESFVLRYPQGWLCDDNVYFAEGKEYFSLAVSDSCDEIFVSELSQTFKRYDYVDIDELLREVEQTRQQSEELLSPKAIVSIKDIDETDVLDDIEP